MDCSPSYDRTRSFPDLPALYLIEAPLRASSSPRRGHGDRRRGDVYGLDKFEFRTYPLARDGPIGRAGSRQAKHLSDDRARALTNYYVPRTGSLAVPGAGSDRGRGRELEHATLFDPQPPHRNPRRHFHSRFCRQSATRDSDAAHSCADRTRRHRDEKRERHRHTVPIDAERAAVGKLHPIRAQDKIPAGRDLWPAREDR